MEEEHFECTSLCKIIPDLSKKGTPIAERLADIDSDGCLVSFKVDYAQNQIFENRSRIFLSDGPNEEGTIGVWQWKATPNNTSPSDYIKSHFRDDLEPIQVILLSGVESESGLQAALKRDIGHSIVCNKVFVCYNNLSWNAGYEGVLCKARDFNQDSDKVVISDEVVRCRKYWIKKEDVLEIGIYRIYKKFSFSEDDYEGMLFLKEPFDIVKACVLRRASWQSVKQQGVTRNDFKYMKEFLEKITNNDLYAEISEECECDEDTAKSFLDGFIENVDVHLSGDDLDEKILAGLVNSSQELQKKCIAELEKRWTIENEELIQNARNELKSVNDEQDQAKTRLEKFKSDENAAKSTLASIEKQIKQKNVELEDLDYQVNNKLKSISDNITDFAGNIAMLRPFMGGGIQSGKNAYDSYSEGTERYDSEAGNWEESLSALEEELPEAGTDAHQEKACASFLYSSYINHVPVLLAGPNAVSIANAFSTAVFGRMAGCVNCLDEYDSAVIRKIQDSNDKVIIFKDALKGQWIDEIIKLECTSERFYFLTTPYSEDLKMEPHELFNYVFPCLTEFFVVKRATNNFLGSTRKENFENFEIKDIKPIYDKLLRKMNISLYLKNQIQNVLGVMHDINEELSNEDEILYVFCPYAYVLDKGEKILDKIGNDMDSDVKATVIHKLGVDDEQ